VQHLNDLIVGELQPMLQPEGPAAQPGLPHARGHQIAVLGVHLLQEQFKAGWLVGIKVE
jgi:hypothetical protein